MCTASLKLAYLGGNTQKCAKSERNSVKKNTKLQKFHNVFFPKKCYYNVFVLNSKPSTLKEPKNDVEKKPYRLPPPMGGAEGIIFKLNNLQIRPDLLQEGAAEELGDLRFWVLLHLTSHKKRPKLVLCIMFSGWEHMGSLTGHAYDGSYI